MHALTIINLAIGTLSDLFSPETDLLQANLNGRQGHERDGYLIMI